MNLVNLSGVDDKPGRYAWGGVAILLGAIAIAIAIGLASGGCGGPAAARASASETSVASVAVGPPIWSPATAGPWITQAEARRRIEAAGRSWAEFTATTTVRDRYEAAAIAAWLR